MLSPLQKKVMGFRHSNDKLSKESKRKRGNHVTASSWDGKSGLCEGETAEEQKGDKDVKSQEGHSRRGNRG